MAMPFHFGGTAIQVHGGGFEARKHRGIVRPSPGVYEKQYITNLKHSGNCHMQRLELQVRSNLLKFDVSVL